ncbi:uncharacterized protein LOC122316158 [Carya illinoinensis]|uniref:uncharacterized protein LOC122316158 n=1 Tax=Carya illinoinensis TaxID=32201 RepID=UPI001C728D55|nr:uncharacterized protein LOC122316158 [Carya illinoinensis]
MDSLIDENTKWLQVNKTTALFNPKVVADIMKIILCPSEQLDKQTWLYEEDGKFNVRSVYRMIKEKFYKFQRECYDANRQQALWKSIWRMKGLPTQYNLSKKKIPTEGFCYFCKERLEDLPHALLYCSTIKEISAYDGNMEPQLSIMDVAMKVKASGFAYFKDRGIFQMEASSSRSSKVKYRWGWGVSNSSFPIGVILRDEHGDVIMAASILEPNGANPESVELLAIFHGLQLCATMGISKLIVECDCLLMEKEMQTKAEYEVLYGNLL